MQEFLEAILKSDVQDFVRSHQNDDVQKLLLKYKTFSNVSMEWICRQISGRQKAKQKLPTWYAADGIVYPPSINIEQCSSEATAKFKSKLFADLREPHAIAADLTGGMGVDTYYIGKHATTMDCVEPDGDLLEIARHNHTILGAHNIRYHQATAESFLKDAKKEFDLIYVDPSRRKNTKKVYKFSDCEPDVVALQPLLDSARHAMIKTSPLLDLQAGSIALRHVARIVVLSVDNDCKEVLFLMDKDFAGEPEVHAHELDRYGESQYSISFRRSEEMEARAEYSPPLAYLYEPGAALMKAGAFQWIAQHYQLKKLAPNSHLYTSNEMVDFPGRIFRILSQIKLEKKVRDLYNDGYANIISRNHPLDVGEIKKKTGLKEGGTQYLICTQTQKEKIALVANRIR